MGNNIDDAIWRKSSYSGGNCVEVARSAEQVIDQSS